MEKNKDEINESSLAAATTGKGDETDEEENSNVTESNTPPPLIDIPIIISPPSTNDLLNNPLARRSKLNGGSTLGLGVFHSKSSSSSSSSLSPLPRGTSDQFFIPALSSGSVVYESVGSDVYSDANLSSPMLNMGMITPDQSQSVDIIGAVAKKFTLEQLEEYLSESLIDTNNNYNNVESSRKLTEDYASGSGIEDADSEDYDAGFIEAEDISVKISHLLHEVNTEGDEDVTYFKRIVDFIQIRPQLYPYALDALRRSFYRFVANQHIVLLDILFTSWFSSAEMKQLPIKSDISYAIYDIAKINKLSMLDRLIYWYEQVSTLLEVEVLLCDVLVKFVESVTSDSDESIKTLEHIIRQIQNKGMMLPICSNMQAEWCVISRRSIKKVASICVSRFDSFDIKALKSLVQLCGRDDICTLENLDIMIGSGLSINDLSEFIDEGIYLPLFSPQELKTFIDQTQNDKKRNIVKEVLDRIIQKDAKRTDARQEIIVASLKYLDLDSILRTSETCFSIRYQMLNNPNEDPLAIGLRYELNNLKEKFGIENKNKLSDKVLMLCLPSDHDEYMFNKLSKLRAMKKFLVELGNDCLPIATQIIEDVILRCTSQSSSALDGGNEKDQPTAASGLSVIQFAFEAITIALDGDNELLCPTIENVLLLISSLSHPITVYFTSLILRMFYSDHPSTCVQFSTIELLFQTSAKYNNYFMIAMMGNFLLDKAKKGRVTWDQVRTAVASGLSSLEGIDEGNDASLITFEQLLDIASELYYLGSPLLIEHYKTILSSITLSEVLSKKFKDSLVNHMEKVFGVEYRHILQSVEHESSSSNSPTAKGGRKRRASFSSPPTNANAQSSKDRSNSADIVHGEETRKRRGSSIGLSIALEMAINPYGKDDIESSFQHHLLESVRSGNIVKVGELLEADFHRPSHTTLYLAYQEAKKYNDMEVASLIKSKMGISAAEDTLNSNIILDNDEENAGGKKQKYYVNLETLADDMFDLIGSFLDVRSLACMGQVCTVLAYRPRKFAQIVHSLVGDYLLTRPRDVEDINVNDDIPYEMSRLILSPAVTSSSSSGEKTSSINSHNELSRDACQSALRKIMHMCLESDWTDMKNVYSQVGSFAAERDCEVALEPAIRAINPLGEYVIEQKDFFQIFTKGCDHQSKSSIKLMLRVFLEENNLLGARVGSDMLSSQATSLPHGIPRLQIMQVINAMRTAAEKNHIGLIPLMLIPLLQVVTDVHSPASRQFASNVIEPVWGAEGVGGPRNNANQGNTGIASASTGGVVAAGAATPSEAEGRSQREMMEIVIRNRQAWILGSVIYSATEYGHAKLCQSLVAMAVARGLLSERSMQEFLKRSFLHSCRQGYDDIIKVFLLHGGSAGKVAIAYNITEGVQTAAKNGKRSTCEVLFETKMLPVVEARRIFVDSVRKGFELSVETLIQFPNVATVPTLETCISEAQKRGFVEILDVLKKVHEERAAAQNEKPPSPVKLLAQTSTSSTYTLTEPTNDLNF